MSSIQALVNHHVCTGGIIFIKRSVGVKLILLSRSEYNTPNIHHVVLEKWKTQNSTIHGQGCLFKEL
jgi:hypothetical protein